MRDIESENLFERWLDEVVRAAGPYDDYETFHKFSERIKRTAGRPDTPGAVRGSAGDQGGATEPAR